MAGFPHIEIPLYNQQAALYFHEQTISRICDNITQNLWQCLFLRNCPIQIWSLQNVEIF